MSKYKVNDYINKKFNDIYKKEPTVQAYNLGVAVGMLELYKLCKYELGAETTNTFFKSILDGTEEFNVIFRTLVGLYNEETNSKIERMIESIEKYKQPKEEISDEYRDLIEEFLEFLHKKKEKEVK